jgi:hypothetical protein
MGYIQEGWVLWPLNWLNFDLGHALAACACLRVSGEFALGGRSVCSVRIWPQKSGLFRVSTAPKPSTLFGDERTRVTRWKSSLGTYTFSKLDTFKKNIFGHVHSQNDPLKPLDQGSKMNLSPFCLIFFCSPPIQIQAA